MRATALARRVQQRGEKCRFMRRADETSEDMMGYVAQALVLLLGEKPYAKISVKEIAERAGVNRATYYRHFETKDDVVRHYYARIMDEYLDRFRALGNPDYRLYLTVMFTTFSEHADGLLAIHRAGLSWALRDALEEAFGFEEVARSAPRDQQFKVSYHIGGIFNNLLLWFEHGMDETPREMAAIAMSYRPADPMMLFNA